MQRIPTITPANGIQGSNLLNGCHLVMDSGPLPRWDLIAKPELKKVCVICLGCAHRVAQALHMCRHRGFFSHNGRLCCVARCVLYACGGAGKLANTEKKPQKNSGWNHTASFAWQSGQKRLILSRRQPTHQTAVLCSRPWPRIHSDKTGVCQHEFERRLSVKKAFCRRRMVRQAAHCRARSFVNHWIVWLSRFWHCSDHDVFSNRSTCHKHASLKQFI